jgi:hypothetical protein
VRLRVHLLDSKAQKELGSFDEDLGPNGARLTGALPNLSARLRTVLGASLTDEQETALSASRVRSPDAAQLYAEGMMSARRWEPEVALSRFEAAVAADPSFLDAQRNIAWTWELQGNQRKAREGWQHVRGRQNGLTARGIAEIDLKLLELGPDEQKANDARMALFEATPDDVDLGLAIARRSPSRARLVLVKRLRELPNSPALLLDLAEAYGAWISGDLLHAEQLLNRASARATELGARWELARVRHFQGGLLYTSDPLRWNEALARLLEAERLFAEVGELDNLAQVKQFKSDLLFNTGARRQAVATLDEAAGVQRRLGNRKAAADLVALSAEGLNESWELDAAAKRLDEARAELEALEAPLTPYFRVRAELAIDTADLHAAQDALRQMRRGEESPHASFLEANILYEQDHREEARSTYQKAAVLGELLGNRLFEPSNSCGVDCDGDQPAAGLACLAQHCQADQPGFEGLHKGRCRVLEARCRFRANDLTGAELAARDALTILEPVSLESALRARTILTRIAAARGESAKAVQKLRAELARVESKHHTRMAFEVALALGDVELKAGRPEGRARLLKLEEEAKSREFFRIARLAREALDRKPVVAGAQHH